MKTVNLFYFKMLLIGMLLHWSASASVKHCSAILLNKNFALDGVKKHIMFGKWKYTNNHKKILLGGLHDRHSMENWILGDETLVDHFMGKGNYRELENGVAVFYLPKTAIPVTIWEKTKGQKTTFPRDWDWEDIEKAITFVTSTSVPINMNGKLLSDGIYNGVKIRVVFTMEYVISAYPVAT